MVKWTEEPTQVPWLPVYDDSTDREPLAPSKPAVPSRTPAALEPEPVEVDEPGADIIAPVPAPPPEETMPTDGKAPWDSVPVFTAPTSTPSAPPASAIQSLGDAAVRRASLSASGAAMPLGGVAPSAPSSLSAAAPVSNEVPLVTSPYQVPPEQSALHDAEPDDSPTGQAHAATTDQSEVAPGQTEPAPPEPDVVHGGANPARASAFPPVATAPGFMAATTPTSAASPPRSSTPELDDEAAPYTPLFGTPGIPDPSGGDAGDGDEPPVEDKRTPWWRSWPFLVVVGLLVMGGIAYAVIAAMSDTEPVELTEPVIVPTPDEPSHEPISIEDPTGFQQALPEMVDLYALTGFESPEVDTLDLLERAAEANLLTYQYEDITLSARAIQHFDVNTAERHFDQIALEGTDREPVTAGDTEVGERVTISGTDAETLVWRNSTALFFVTGPDEHLEEFFTHFPF